MAIHCSISSLLIPQSYTLSHSTLHQGVTLSVQRQRRLRTCHWYRSPQWTSSSRSRAPRLWWRQMKRNMLFDTCIQVLKGPTYVPAITLPALKGINNFTRRLVGRTSFITVNARRTLQTVTTSTSSKARRTIDRTQCSKWQWCSPTYGRRKTTRWPVFAFPTSIRPLRDTNLLTIPIG